MSDDKKSQGTVSEKIEVVDASKTGVLRFYKGARPPAAGEPVDESKLVAEFHMPFPHKKGRN